MEKPLYPTNPKDLSCEFLSSVLGRSVERFGISTSAIQGCCSIVLQLKVWFCAGNPVSEILYAKFSLPLLVEEKFSSVSNSSTPEASAAKAWVDRDWLVHLAAYRKEVLFYKYMIRWLPDLAARVLPSVVFAEISDDPSKDEFLLILRNGGSPLDQLQGCGRHVCRQVVEQLARFHAPFIDASALLTNRGLNVCTNSSHVLLCRVKGISDEITAEELLAHCKTHFCNMFSDFREVTIANFLDETPSWKDQATSMLNEIETIMTHKQNLLSDWLESAFRMCFLQPSFRSLVHGDFRLDNMLWDEVDGTVRFLDFQALYFGHVSYDLGQFIFQTVTFNDGLKQPGPGERSESSSCPTVAADDQREAEQMLVELVTSYFHTLCSINPELGRRTTLEDLLDDVRTVAIFQLLSMCFYMAPLKSNIDPVTRRLDGADGRLMKLVRVLTLRSLRAFLWQFQRIFVRPNIT